MAAHHSTLSRHLLTRAFAIMRTAVGAVSLFIPTQAAAIFGIGTIDQSRIMFRLFGARELALGTLLWYSHSRVGSTTTKADDEQAHRQDLKRLLWIGVVIDTIDLVSSGVCIAEGNLDGKAIWLVGAGAGVFAGLGMACLGTVG